MAELVDLCLRFGVSNVDGDVCQKYIETPIQYSIAVDDSMLSTIGINIDHETFIDSIDIVKEISSSMDVDMNIAVTVKRLAAAALYSVNNSVDANIISIACRFLLHLCKLPGATVYGVSNTNLVANIGNTLLKVISEESKAPIVHVPKISKSLEVEEPVKGSRQSKRIAGASQIDDNYDEEDDIAGMTQTQNDSEIAGTQTQSETGKYKRLITTRITQKSLNELLIDLRNTLDLFSKRSEDHPLECFTEALSAMAFLSVISPGFSSYQDYIISTIIELASHSTRCLMSVYRALMPLLTLNGRDNRVPDNSKMRTNAHKISLRIISGIIKKNDISENEQNVETRLEGEEGVSLPIALTCIIGALQRMTLSVPDRAPIRATVLTSIAEILTVLQKKYEVTEFQPIQLAINHFFIFLSKLARSKKVGYRAYCLEIAASLIAKEWIWTLPGDNCAGPKALISLIVSRCDDIAPTVRNRAINAFCDLLENLSEVSPRPMCEYLLQLALGVDIQIAGVSNNVNLLDIVRNRCADERPLVRAKSIQIYGLIFATKWPKHVYDSTADDEVAIEFITMHMSEEDINVFVDGCNDVSLAVRKQSVFSLTNLLQARPTDEMLHEAWVLGALPLASDCESTVQNRLGQCAFDLLISRVVETASTSTSIAAWSICVKIAAIGRNKLLRSAIGNAYRQGLFKSDASVFSIKKVVKAVKSACCTELDRSNTNGEIVSRGAWVLLEALIGHEPSANETNIIADSFKHDKGSADFVVQCFRAKREKAEGPNLSEDDIRMLRVLTKLVNSLSTDDIEYMKNELFKILVSMECNSSGLSVIITLMFSLTNPSFIPSSNPKDEYHNVIAWTKPLLSIAHSIIHSYIWGKNVEGQESLGKQVTSSLSTNVKNLLVNSTSINCAEHSDLVTTALFMIGEFAMLGFSIAEDETSRTSQASYIISDVTKSFKLVFSEVLVDLIQMLMSLQLPNGVEIVEAVRAHAFLTLGKLCLRDKSRAREVVNVFLRELHENSSTSHAAVRSNSLLVLGDLCVRYTNLIDRHVGAMAACLQDKNPMVRRHALILLTQLILQDFLKWRGMLLFRFLATAADTDSEMSEFAKTLLKNTLRSKYPDFFAHHFAECVIVFNGYIDHPTYVAAASSGSEGGSCPVTMEGVDLEGRNRRSARLKLYAMMMEDFSEEQKIAVSAKLVQDIVGHFVDAASSRKDENNVSDAMEEALEDALIILQSPLLKVGKKTNENGEEEGGDELEGEEESSKAALAKAKSKVLAKLSRQHLVSNILPVVMSLKAVLEANRSPLQGSVMEYLVHLIKNNRNEVNQVLSADPTLKAEVEYDLKIFEKAKEEKAARKVAQAVVEDAAADFNVSMNFDDKNDEANIRRLSVGLSSAVKTAKKSDMKVAMSSSILASPMIKSALRNNNILGSPMLKSALRNTNTKGKSYSRTPKESMKQIGFEDNSDDLANRLLGGEPNDNNYQREDDENQPLSKNWRRRSWSVRVQLESELVDGLEDNDDENINSNISGNGDETSDSPDKKRSTMTTDDDKVATNSTKQTRGRRVVGPSSLLALGSKN